MTRNSALRRYSLNGPMQKFVDRLDEDDTSTEATLEFLEDFLPGIELKVTREGYIAGYEGHWYIVRAHKNGSWAGAYIGEEEPSDRSQDYLVTFAPRFNADGRSEATVALVALIYADNDDSEFLNLMELMSLA